MAACSSELIWLVYLVTPKIRYETVVRSTHRALPNFVKKVRSVSFSAKRAIKNGQKVLYITERCVFRLTPRGLKLIESYPGIDVKKDILDKLPFEVEL